MDINFNNMEEINSVNSRVDYDLRYSEKTGKFTLSQEAYELHDINNHGFILKHDGYNTVFQVVPNEEATLHKGRANASQKGRMFTANLLKRLLKIEGDTEFMFELHEHEGDKYLAIKQSTETETKQQDSEDSITNREFMEKEDFETEYESEESTQF
ncbi:MAG: hypothetical protein WD512_05810 [Candidatus Paceibacterota bacterium]